MNINRNNYEELFLLYVDNELSAADKKAVDVFLQQNPDLQEEMAMLRQAVLKPENVSFENKGLLLKHISIDEGIQGKMLLLLDGELNEKEATQLNRTIAADDLLKNEFEILKQTKLSAADKIIFEEKHLLYRKEEGRVVPIRWWRVAVAAACIAMGIWGGISYLSKTKTDITTQTAVNKNSKEDKRPSNIVAVPEQPKTNDAAEVKEQTTAAAEENNTNKKSSAETALPEEKVLKPSISKDKTNKEETVASSSKEEQKPSNKLPKPVFENLNRPESNIIETATVTPEKKEINNVAETIKENLKQANNVAEPAANTYAVQTIYIDNSGEGNSSFGDDERDDKRSRSKLGGFFKKVKRVLERKANIKNSDNSIKVASFSFAAN